MDLWMKIASAVLMGMMLVFLFPRAKQMLQEGPKGSSQEWVSALIPLALVIGFVVFYTILLIIEVYLMQKFARLGPSSLHTGRYYHEQPGGKLYHAPSTNPEAELM